jgi:hypothetical protein
MRSRTPLTLICLVSNSELNEDWLCNELTELAVLL